MDEERYRGGPSRRESVRPAFSFGGGLDEAACYAAAASDTEEGSELGADHGRPESPSLWRKARLINKFMAISPKVKRKTGNAKNKIKKKVSHVVNSHQPLNRLTKSHNCPPQKGGLEEEDEESAEDGDMEKHNKRKRHSLGGSAPTSEVLPPRPQVLIPRRDFGPSSNAAGRRAAGPFGSGAGGVSKQQTLDMSAFRKVHRL